MYVHVYMYVRMQVYWYAEAPEALALTLQV